MSFIRLCLQIDRCETFDMQTFDMHRSRRHQCKMCVWYTRKIANCMISILNSGGFGIWGKGKILGVFEGQERGCERVRGGHDCVHVYPQWDALFNTQDRMTQDRMTRKLAESMQKFYEWLVFVPWLDLWDMTHVAWHIDSCANTHYTCAMTHLCVCHDVFTCVTWLSHVPAQRPTPL